MDFAPNIAIFVDFENVALGVRDAKYDEFDVHLVLERLLDKGKIVVKKAYADWERFRGSRRALHESSFELIEIPHVSYSGKNSADIRMVVDALDLCYTKEHVDVFCVVSGDSDFSPLVSKLRENNKKVIGMGVKNSSSDLLIENCDEFIYYDDLVRHRAKQAKATKQRLKEPAPKPADAKDAAKDQRPASKAADSTDDGAGRKEKAIEMVLETVDALFRERDDNLWGSMVKQTLKRKRPSFSETFHGYRSFNELLEDTQDRGLLEIQKDEKSGGYLIVSFGPNA
jgi:uncharacterized protein (TIGR00288 family)